MRFLLSHIALVSMALGAIPPTALRGQTEIDERALRVAPTHYRLDVRIDYEGERLEGTARVTVRNVSGQAVRELPFLLYRLMQVEAARDGAGRPLPFEQRVVAVEDFTRQQVNAIAVRLPGPLPAGEAATVELDYGGHLLGYAETGMAYIRDRIDPAFTILRDDAHAFPGVGYPNRGINRAAGLPSYEYQATIEVPESLVVANGGALVSRQERDGRARYTYRSLVPSWRMDFAIGPYRELVEGPVRIFYLRPDSLGAAYMAGAARRGLDLFAEWFGPLRGEPALTVLEIEDGYGSQADVVTILQAAAAFRDSMRVRELYHELSHLWNPPDNDRPSPRWNEGLASLVEDLAVEALHGRQVVDGYMPRLLAWLRGAASANGWTDVAMIDYGHVGKTDASYSVGQLMFYLLYRIVGPEDFRRTVGGFYQRYAVDGATTDDFVTYVRQVGGPATDALFRDWLYTVDWWALVESGTDIEDLVARYTNAAQPVARASPGR